MNISTTKAWNELSKYVLNFINSKIDNRSDAEDIRQDVFTKIHLNISNLKDEEKLQSWAFNITRNSINDYWRKKKNIISLDESSNYVAESTELDDWTIPFENCLSKMISDLPERYREVIFLSEIKNQKQKELAFHLNLSYSGIKSRIQRGRELLKHSFKACCNIEINKSGQIISGNIEMNNCNNC